MADILQYTGLTGHDININDVLEGAKEALLREVVVCGYDDDGNLYVASSKGDTKHVFWALHDAIDFIKEQARG